MKFYDFSANEAAAKLDDFYGLGDRRPSDMLALMLTLNGDNEAGAMFRERFLRQLLDDVRVTLAALQLKDVTRHSSASDDGCEKATSSTGHSSATDYVNSPNGCYDHTTSTDICSCRPLLVPRQVW